MQLSDIFLQLGEENFNNLLRSISMGRLKTYQLYDRVKTILYLNKLNSETLRKAAPRIWARIGERNDEFATEVSQAILISHLDMIRAVLDHQGIPHEDGFFAKDADLSVNKFMANEPEGMFEGLKWIVRTFPNLPIIVTENGVEDSDDHMRRRYLAQHIHQLWRAVNFNWPVKGYFHWTLVDNFEWERGWTYQFGLWGLDRETQKRIKRPSVDLYAEICKENGLSSEMVQKHCPEVFERLFPI